MAEKKKAPVERKIVSAADAKAAQKPSEVKNAPAKKDAPVQAVTPTATAEKKPSGGLRIGAVVLWVLAIGFEVAAILLLNKTLSLPKFSMTTWLIIAIVLDLILVVIGSQLWKKANHQDPASEKNKVKFWLWNNMGVIAAVVAFFPLIIMLLKYKDLDPKTKKLVSVIAVIALLIAGTASYDWNPVSQEDLEAQRTALAEEGVSTDSTVYWTPFGKVYHLDPDCQALTNSATLINGSLDEAFEAKRVDLCKFCAKNAGVEIQPSSDDVQTPADDAVGDDLAA